jgi:hypothetical protein
LFHFELHLVYEMIKVGIQICRYNKMRYSQLDANLDDSKPSNAPG